MNIAEDKKAPNRKPFAKENSYAIQAWTFSPNLNQVNIWPNGIMKYMLDRPQWCWIASNVYTSYDTDAG